MTEYQPARLTAAELHDIETRAHAMRAEAMASALRATARGIGIALHKLSALVIRPRTA